MAVGDFVWLGFSYLPGMIEAPLNMRPRITRKTVYSLEVYQLSKPFRTMDSVTGATRLHNYESATDFGTFHKGDTFSDSNPTKYLGTIQHVHHWLGDDEGPDIIHRTVLYVFNEG